MINTRLKPVTTGLIGAVGLGVALLGMPEAAKAANVQLGTDYLYTPGGGTTYLDLSEVINLDYVTFKGMPIDQNKIGLTDTIVQRKQTVILDATTLNVDGMCISAKCQTPIEMTDILLRDQNGYGITVTLNPDRKSTGWMTINQRTFSSVLDVFFRAIFDDGPIFDGFKRFVVGSDQNPYTLAPENPLHKNDPLENVRNPSNNGFGNWGHIPPDDAQLIKVGDNTISRGEMVVADEQKANFHDNQNMDFFVLSGGHDGGDGLHGVIKSCLTGQECLVPVEYPLPVISQGGPTNPLSPLPRPVPEPSTVLGLIAVGLSSIVGFKGKKEPK